MKCVRCPEPQALKRRLTMRSKSRTGHASVFQCWTYMLVNMDGLPMPRSQGTGERRQVKHAGRFKCRLWEPRMVSELMDRKDQSPTAEILVRLILMTLNATAPTNSHGVS